MVGTSKKRRIRVTEANLKNNHIYISGNTDFFPADCFGGATRVSKADKGIQIALDGLNETITTDISTNPKTGKPRGYLRERASIRRFYEHNKIQAGSVLALERLSEREYRLSVERSEPAGRDCPRAAEFFAGIGLVRLALESQGWQVVFANNINPAKAEMYRHNWPHSDHLVVGDIHMLDANDVPPCDLFTASFPCNDLSIAGRWEGLSGKESSAFWGLINLLKDLGDKRPPIVMLENVVGFLISRGGRDFEEALVALNKLGYAVDAVILNAAHWTPQSRARLFVIAERRDCDEGRSFALGSDARPANLVNFIAKHTNIRWSIHDVPPLPVPRAHLAEIVENLPDDDPNWWDSERTEYFMNQLSDRHAIDAKRMIEGKAVSYATAFRRVRHGRKIWPNFGPMELRAACGRRAAAAADKFFSRPVADGIR